MGPRSTDEANAPARNIEVKVCGGSVLVDGFIMNSPCSFTIDTGADVTIMSHRVYTGLKDAEGLQVPHLNESIRGIDGNEIPVLGKVAVLIGLGERRSTRTVWVARIQEDCILGTDFLREEGCVIDYPNNALRLGEAEIPLRSNNHGVRCLRLVLDQSVKVPGHSEMIIPVRVKGEKESFCWGAVGPSGGGTGKRGIMVGRTLIDLKRDCVPVRVANFSASRQKLKKGLELAVCEPVTSVTSRVIKGEKPDEPCGKVPSHLKPLAEKTAEVLDEEQSSKITSVLLNYQDVFSRNDGDIGRAEGVQHKIDTANSLPVKQNPRRLPLGKRQEADSAVEKMCAQGVIEKSTSPWCSPVVLVRKKDGTTRFCVDYRRLNDVTRKDSFPLPRVDSTLDALNGSQWFSTLDLKSGYWQVQLEESAKEKTAFSFGKGLWQFNVMPFGLCNAPATFERLMESVLARMPWETCLVYLDDIIVMGKSFDEHLVNLTQVFERLRSSNLKLSPKKCCLCQTQVTYLGYVVTRSGIKPDPKKVEAVQSWPVPVNVQELRSFLGLCSYYRRFVKDFAKIAKPLHSLTQKNTPFKWDEDCQQAFVDLKEYLTRSPVLIYPDPSRQFILDTDASHLAIGAVLSQLIDGKEHPVAYFSRTLNQPEKQYCVTRKELLAVVQAIEHFHPYLYGRHFMVRTDHASLQWLLNFKALEGQLARWMQKLGEYDFEVKHRKGAEHGNADALSRRPCFRESCKYCERTEVKSSTQRSVTDDVHNGKSYKAARIQAEASSDTIPDFGITRQEQLEDPDIRVIIQLVEESETKPAWEKIASYSLAVKVYWGQWQSLQIIDGKLYRCLDVIPPETQCKQLIIPTHLRSMVLQHLHDS